MHQHPRVVQNNESSQCVKKKIGLQYIQFERFCKLSSSTVSKDCPHNGFAVNNKLSNSRVHDSDYNQYIYFREKIHS